MVYAYSFDMKVFNKLNCYSNDCFT